jgi:hypothetical protein
VVRPSFPARGSPSFRNELFAECFFKRIGMTKHVTDLIDESIGKLPPKRHVA